MGMNTEDVKYIAALARLKFSDDELINFTHKFNEILNYVEKLNELDTENVEPLEYPIDNVNFFREDINKQSINTEEALKNAPDTDGIYFKVPKVIKQ
ncbi:MAG: Asp-tRNA(Asn)/Glu-tRNA(Gln) amidotransferase subunit GatC [bacterium]